MLGRRLRYPRSALSIVAGVFCFFAATSLAGCPEQDTQRTIRTLDELPRHTYPVSDSVREVFGDREALAELARRVRADISSDLKRYKIEDRTALARLHQVLVNAAIVEADFHEALAQIEQVRQLAVRDSARLMAGFPFEAILRTRTEAGNDEAKFRDLLTQKLQKQLDAMPWDKVGDDITEFKGIAETMGDALLVGDMLEQMDSQVSLMNGVLSSGMAADLLDVWVKVNLALPVKSELSNACGLVIRERRAARESVWGERFVALGVSEKLTPVVVAIWDSGVDTSLFAKRLWVNEKETLDGIDNDGNGFIDDIHGIAHGLYGKTLRNVMKSSGEMTVSKEEAERRLRGYLDIHEALETDDAAYVSRIMEGLDRSGMAAFVTDLYES